MGEEKKVFNAFVDVKNPDIHSYSKDFEGEGGRVEIKVADLPSGVDDGIAQDAAKFKARSRGGPDISFRSRYIKQERILACLTAPGAGWNLKETKNGQQVDAPVDLEHIRVLTPQVGNWIYIKILEVLEFVEDEEKN